MEFITREFELTHRLISMIKDAATKTQLNEAWVFAALIEAGLKRTSTEDIWSIETKRKGNTSLPKYSVCINTVLNDKIRNLARLCSIITDDGDSDLDETAARLLILALTDRESEFKDSLNQDDLDQLFLSNPELGLKIRS
ncbi:MAG: hypothetical protein K2Y22_15190 [Candidatus Obscuribacterales bacterium]|nr:hypothetical protein [Candidatus Obscuribacterales bacterium]